MTTYIALLRGINVGGANILPMKELASVLESIGRSKLAANVERAIGVTATGRNWRTVTKLMSMAEDLAAP